MLEPGSLVADRFEIKGELGRGGSAAVYLAEDRATGGSRVALKMLHGHLGNEEVVRSRLGREVMACRRLSHPNILPVYELHASGGQVFLSMAYHPGRNLTEVIEDSGPLTIDAARRLGMAVASALQEAHLKGIIHRDLKPQNLLIDEAGDVQLTDFGLARLGDMSTVTATGQLLGTPGYVPPEVLIGERWEPRGDLYGLGVVLYQALTGQMPFQGMSALAVLRAQGEGPPPPPSTLRAEIPGWMDAIVVALLNPSPVGRPGGASAVYSALEERRSPFAVEVVRAEPSSVSRGPGLPGVERSKGVASLFPSQGGEGHTVFLTGKDQGRGRRRRRMTPEQAIQVGDALKEEGYTLPERFEGELIGRWESGRKRNLALVEGLTQSEADALYGALKRRGVGAEIDGHRLGPFFLARSRSDSFWPVLSFLPALIFIPPKIGLFIISMIVLSVLRRKAPEPVLSKGAHPAATLAPPRKSNDAQALPEPSASPLPAPKRGSELMEERVRALGESNRQKAARIKEKFKRDDALPAIALRDLRLRVEEVLSATDGLERGTLALVEILDDLDESKLLGRLTSLEQRQQRHRATEGAADPALEAAIAGQRQSIERLQRVEADIGRHMAQLMTLGASLDSIALLTAQARLAQDMDLMDGVSRVVSRLEGDVASAAKILQEDGLPEGEEL